MSSETLAWALSRMVERAALKLLLVTVADLANHVTEEVYPSIAYLEAATGLSKRTVLSGLDELCEMGVLERTDRRKGRTGQIPVYLFHMTERLTAIIKLKVAETGTKSAPLKKEVQKRLERGDILHGKEVQKRTPEPSNRNLEGNIPPLPSGEATPTDDSDLFRDACPAIAEPVLHEFVMSEWSKLKEEHPRVQAIEVMSPARTAKIGARARDAVGSDAAAQRRVWTRIFAAIRASAFLRGDAEPGRGYNKPMTLGLDYVLQPTRFNQILERAPIDERDDRESRTAGGRTMGPAEQAGRAALAGMGSAPERRAEIGGGGIYLPKRSRRA